MDMPSAMYRNDMTAIECYPNHNQPIGPSCKYAANAVVVNNSDGVLHLSCGGLLLKVNRTPSEDIRNGDCMTVIVS